MRSTIRLLPALIALAFASGLSPGDEVPQFSIDAWSIDGGGGTSSGGDFELIDCQMTTSHLQSIGDVELGRSECEGLLDRSL